jgi:hypothetical protein
MNEEALLMCIRCLSKYSLKFIDYFRVLFFLSNLYGKHIKHEKIEKLIVGLFGRLWTFFFLKVRKDLIFHS